ncbi:putative transmembrane protein 244 isoform X2 [Halichoeres trimaculatus]|uniref:putative transmembrane protein 244 isoform X2 n=1 Tax=Halichoeres trimaculatus TaxID=147232 RepID=UPI003D9F16ED
MRVKLCSTFTRFLILGEQLRTKSWLSASQIPSSVLPSCGDSSRHTISPVPWEKHQAVVLQNLLMCMVCFYSLYYIVVSLCIGLLRVHEINSLLTPFDYTAQPSWQNPKYLVMSDFPSAEQWWIALASGLVMMIFGGQLLAYKLFRSNFVYPTDLQNF